MGRAGYSPWEDCQGRGDEWEVHLLHYLIHHRVCQDISLVNNYNTS